MFNHQHAYMAIDHCPLIEALNTCAKIFRERAAILIQITDDYEQRVLKPMKNIAESKDVLSTSRS